MNDLNFENVSNALVTLLAITTLDNWIGIQNIAKNSDLARDVKIQKKFDLSKYGDHFSNRK